MTTTPGGLLLVLAVLVPFAGVLAGFVLGGRNAQRVAMVTILAGCGIAIAIAASMARSDGALVYLLGGWAPPLGIALRADGLALVMIPAVAVVILGIGVYACADFGTPPGVREARAPLVFWTLLLAIWGALNLVFVSGDLFTLYVALELLTFAAVPLVSLDGRPETLRAALRYLLYALLGSVLYLLGAVLLYGAYGTLDIQLLAGRIRPDPATLAAAAFMTAGLLAKTALFPLHLWLPPAHAGAPAAASAVLSGLVIKGSWFLVVRLWFDVMPGVVTAPSAQLLAALGAGAILVGNVVALRQERLKLLVAYSTVAQIGYLFLMFPLAFDAGAGALGHGGALTGGMLQAVSHATAKAAMFMAAGLIYHALGHDRIAGLAGAARALPVTVLTFVLAGLALMGLPPSGAYVAKKLLLDASAASGQWWWEVVMQAGGLLTASYVVLVLAHALSRADAPVKLHAPVSRLAETAALALALCSLLLGFVAVGAGLPDALSSAFTPASLGSALLIILGGGALAIGLGLQLPPIASANVLIAILSPLRRTSVAVGGMLARTDGVLRQWPVAGLALIALAIAFGAALVAKG
jgi:formate hydrogenlyase subunit 3/multisubunit Na+/H+ antiporter MnhD subunit